MARNRIHPSDKDGLKLQGKKLIIIKPMPICKNPNLSLQNSTRFVKNG